MRTDLARHSYPVVAPLAVAVLCVVSACSSSSTPSESTNAAGAPTSTAATAVSTDTQQVVTPVVAHVPVAPIPFSGSDAKTHLVYELFVTNASSLQASIQQLEVSDVATNKLVATLDQAAVGRALVVLGSSDRTGGDGSLGPAQSAMLYLDVELAGGTSAPKDLTHKLSVSFSGMPQPLEENNIAAVAVDNRRVPDVGPPLSGSGYVAADACCDSTRHRRAVLPVNGSLYLSQRYAIDWEQINGEGKVYVGDRLDLKSYFIYGDDILSVTDGTVVKVLDGLPEQVPGKFPDNPPLDEVDGNSVLVDIGGGTFAAYAHMQPGSPAVKVGQKVKRGDKLGLVGNSGNSLAPHLHVHLQNGPLVIASTGIPYTIDSVTIAGHSVSTAAFDKAEAEGTPLEFTPVNPPTSHRDQYPMDQSIVTMGTGSTAGTTGTTR
jgi:hypothetical protein